jgi:hypothetical protein
MPSAACAFALCVNTRCCAVAEREVHVSHVCVWVGVEEGLDNMRRPLYSLVRPQVAGCCQQQHCGVLEGGKVGGGC